MHFVAVLMSAVAMVTCCRAVADGAEILFVTLYGSESHVVAVIPAMEALSTRGHNVTYLTLHEPERPLENVTVLPLNRVKTFVASARRDLFKVDTNSMGEVAGWLSHVTSGVCKALIRDPSFRLLVEDNRTRYDAVIMDPHLSDCGLPLVWLLGRPPLIYYCTTALYSWTAMALDIPSPFSYVPLHFLPYTDEMSFSERYINTVYTLVLLAFREMHLKPLVENIIRKDFPMVPDVSDIERNTSFVFANSHSASIDLSRPLAPFFAEVGGTHCRPPRPLPKELDDFITEAGDDGFVYVDVGPYVSDGCMALKTARSFLKAFGKLKQKVIWKFDEDLPNVPPNVKFTRSTPRQDLLGHPKIRLFITQGGHLSLQEAVYHAVPVLGLPIFGKHFAALKNFNRKGIAEILDCKRTNAETIHESMMKMITDVRYKQSCLTYSQLFVDRPMKAIDTVVYWVEYIVRHEGGRHLRFNTEHLNIFQYFLLDVMATVIVGLLVIVYVLFKMAHVLAGMCRCGLMRRSRSVGKCSVQYKKLK